MELLDPGLPYQTDTLCSADDPHYFTDNSDDQGQQEEDEVEVTRAEGRVRAGQGTQPDHHDVTGRGGPLSPH